MCCNVLQCGCSVFQCVAVCVTNSSNLCVVSTRSWCFASARCNTMQHTATHCDTVFHRDPSQKSALYTMCYMKVPYRCLLRNFVSHNPWSTNDAVTHCNILQNTSTHCNTLQNTNTVLHTVSVTTAKLPLTLQRTATHCNTLQNIATHCKTLQHTATHCSTLQHIATHRNTMQHTATHCNTLHQLKLLERQ